MNPLYFTLFSLNFGKNKGRMDENMMFENRKMVSSSGKLPIKKRNQNQNPGGRNVTQDLIRPAVI